VARRRRGRPVDGILVLDKPLGVSSNQALQMVKRLYFAAKAALLSMARSMAAEIGPSGVTVNCISPGLIGHASSHDQVQARLASRVPLGRLGTVEDVIPVVELLLSERGASKGIDRRMLSKTVVAYGQWLAMVLLVPMAAGGSPPTSLFPIPPSPFAPWHTAHMLA